jgi:hypothetical protein
MQLCDLCRLIPFGDLPPLPECFTSSTTLGPGLIFRQPNIWQHRPERFGFQYHPDLVSLQNAATACPLCSQVHDAAEQLLRALESEPQTFNRRQLPWVRPMDYRLQITRISDGDSGLIVWTDANYAKSIFIVAVVHLSVEGSST